MILIEDLEDDIIDALKKSDLGLKTVQTHEPQLDEAELKQILALTPLCFVMMEDEIPIEDQRLQDGSAVLFETRFRLLFGTQSLRNKQESQRGCYSLLRGARQLLEGSSFTIKGEKTQEMVWFGNRFEFNFGGKTFYSCSFGLNLQ